MSGMLHNAYTQTPAKVLESGIIEDLFMKRKVSELKNKIARCENGVYLVKFSENIHLIVCFAEEFVPVDDGFVFNIRSCSNKQWLSLIFGEAGIHRFIDIVQSDEIYLKEDSTGKIEKAFLYGTGVDPLSMNDSILIDENSLITVTHDGLQDLALFSYVHASNQHFFCQYYKEKPYGFYDFINNKDDINEFKKRLRIIMRNAEACSRLQLQFKNPLE